VEAVGRVSSVAPVVEVDGAIYAWHLTIATASGALRLAVPAHLRGVRELAIHTSVQVRYREDPCGPVARQLTVLARDEKQTRAH
jgi:hypothetical protein